MRKNGRTGVLTGGTPLPFLKIAVRGESGRGLPPVPNLAETPCSFSLVVKKH
jgi:hypothetical protein